MDDHYLIKRSFDFNIAGVDEAGRGPLAGPVVAAAVILDPARPIDGLADSKKLSESKRDSLCKIIKEVALGWAVAEASVEEIDELNILQATLLAMQRAINGLPVRPDEVLIDGNQLPDLSMPAQAIVKGDSKVKSISAASILAKVERDKIMYDYHNKYPDFSFHLHKAYGTKQHLAEIERFGYLSVHRRSFNPVKTMISRLGMK
ncbi:ribonuclease HII [Methylobacter luteus]|uniref:ribonuclease HII n=1 Tax=Methylobacter luteus TaxID=415 RepID=UPI0003FE6BA0|nr:ribonuclease HII [Methylobacter luteus]